MTIDDVKANLSGLLHGSSSDDLDEIELLLERSANTLLAKIDPVETIRLAALSQTIHDDVYNYALPADYKKLIDLIPQDDRDSWDKATRNLAGEFDLNKAIRNKVVSIEGDAGSKIIRINWRSRKGKVLHTMNSVTDNGIWSAVTGASNIQADSIFKKSGSASIRFDITASGGGIQNSSMSAIDMTDEDEVADVFVWVYLPAVSNLTSITGVWGDALTALSGGFWTSVAQTTQADGTTFKIGWNLIKFSWATATETSTCNPAAIDSFKITFTTTGAISKIRVDNIVFSIGRNFDIKYYSKYLLKSSAGAWLSRTTNDTDVVVLDNDAIEIYNLENLIQAAQQMENDDFDIVWAQQRLNGNGGSPDPEERRGLYAKYRGEYPSQSKKATASYTGRKPGRGRW
jgi:hypothetical protein